MCLPLSSPRSLWGSGRPGEARLGAPVPSLVCQLGRKPEGPHPGANGLGLSQAPRLPCRPAVRWGAPPPLPRAAHGAGEASSCPLVLLEPPWLCSRDPNEVRGVTATWPAPTGALAPVEACPRMLLPPQACVLTSPQSLGCSHTRGGLNLGGWGSLPPSHSATAPVSAPSARSQLLHGCFWCSSLPPGHPHVGGLFLPPTPTELRGLVHSGGVHASAGRRESQDPPIGFGKPISEKVLALCGK